MVKTEKGLAAEAQFALQNEYLFGGKMV